jgi:cytochrome c oxidase subunit II
MIENRVAIAAFVFLMAVTGAIGVSVKMFGIGLPTCLPDVRPFSEGKIIEQSPKHYEVHLLARMWTFEPREISVVPGSTADIYLSTADVTHGVYIAGTNFNLVAVPGAVNYARVKFDKPGRYLVVCNEYCGTAHHNMAGVVHVTKKAAAPPAPPPAPPSSGRELLERNGCTACHSVDGSPGVGPTFKGLYKSRRALANGTTVIADDKYIEESIEKPEAKVVKGFEPSMPVMPLSPAEVHAIVEYLETLR